MMKLRPQTEADRLVVNELALYFPAGTNRNPWRPEGLTDDEAHDAFDLVALSLGCRDDAGRKLVHTLAARAQALANAEHLALRNAARALLSTKRTRWNALAIAAKILRSSVVLRIVDASGEPTECRP